MGLWSTVQQACSVICCCAITLKPLFTQGDFFSRLVSRFSTLGSRSKSSSRGSHGYRQNYVDIEASGPTSYTSTVRADSLSHLQADERNHTAAGYPLKTVKIEQTYEQV